MIHPRLLLKQIDALLVVHAQAKVFKTGGAGVTPDFIQRGCRNQQSEGPCSCFHISVLSSIF